MIITTKEILLSGGKSDYYSSQIFVIKGKRLILRKLPPCVINVIKDNETIKLLLHKKTQVHFQFIDLRIHIILEFSSQYNNNNNKREFE